MSRKKSPAKGQKLIADNANGPMPLAGDPHSSVSGQHVAVVETTEQMPETDEPSSPRPDLLYIADQKASSGTSDLGETIDRIRSLHRQRCFAMDQRKRIGLALGSLARTTLGWSLELPEAARKKIEASAASMIKAGDDPFLGPIIAATKMSRQPFDKIEAAALKEMEQLAKTLPAWRAFGAEVRGFGPGSLAVIIAEAGDLSNYPKKGHLWKRMGLAVMGDVRQGGLKKGASADLWIEHGYNAKRRSKMWNIGDALIKGNRDGEYRSAYLARKEYEREREPTMRPIHAHRRGQRYMEKRLLRNLWQAWRRARQYVPDTAQGSLPDANRSEAAE